MRWLTGCSPRSEPIRSADSLLHVTAAVGSRVPLLMPARRGSLLCADLAMYAAKNRGATGSSASMPSSAREAVTKARLRHDWRELCATGDFCLHYQPIYASDGVRDGGWEVGALGA